MKLKFQGFSRSLNPDLTLDLLNSGFETMDLWLPFEWTFDFRICIFIFRSYSQQPGWPCCIKFRFLPSELKSAPLKTSAYTKNWEHSFCNMSWISGFPTSDEEITKTSREYQKINDKEKKRVPIGGGLEIRYCGYTVIRLFIRTLRWNRRSKKFKKVIWILVESEKDKEIESIRFGSRPEKRQLRC